jgi:long-chain fatty acid transport protein
MFVFGNGFNLNSLGSKASSMGGAFVGLADDFSAIFWNPAGLTQIDTIKMGFFLNDNISFGSYKYKFPFLGIDISANTINNHYFSGMVFYCRPITEKLYTGFAIYMPSHTGAGWDGNDLKELTGGQALKWYGRIGVLAFSPVISFKLNEYLSLGATINVYYGMLALKMPAFEELGQYEEDSGGYGYGATFGILIKPSKILSLGFSLKTPVKIDFDGRAKIPLLSFLDFNPESNFRRDITWPMWIGGGIALKPSENLIITGDIHWTRWSVVKEIYTYYDDFGWKELFESEEMNKMKFDWKDKIQYRIGFEYSLSKKIALRGGYYFDPAPGPNKTLNILLPTYTFNVLTLGLGFKTEDLIIDLGVEYMAGKKRRISMNEIIGRGMPGIHSMKIIAPNISFTYIF